MFLILFLFFFSSFAHIVSYNKVAFDCIFALNTDAKKIHKSMHFGICYDISSSPFYNRGRVGMANITHIFAQLLMVFQYSFQTMERVTEMCSHI